MKEKRLCSMLASLSVTSLYIVSSLPNAESPSTTSQQACKTRVTRLITSPGSGSRLVSKQNAADGDVLVVFGSALASSSRPSYQSRQGPNVELVSLPDDR
ncbi:hypothetical protein F5888DRAFT_1710736 [Russula emetica]|nr:hypothetical protein F5888DRAFT_1710736 [Russula emetica]